jgi:histidinol phosphatase-like PHP family hydrolase
MKDLSRALIKGMETGLIDILAHPTWLPEGIRSQAADLVTAEWVDEVVDAARDWGVAMEVSGAWRVPEEPFVRRCISRGVELSIGSDAHNINMVGETGYAVDLLKRAGAQAQDIFLPTGARR